MQPLMLAPSPLHSLHQPWRFRVFGHYGYWSSSHGEVTKRQAACYLHSLFSLLLGRRKSSLLWRAPQPTAAELTYRRHLPYKKVPSRTFSHLAPLPWGVERSSLSGKMALSLLFLIMSTTKWTSSEITELSFHPVSLFPPGRVPP